LSEPITPILQGVHAGNNDDRLLAGLIEVMRLHPRCPVLLVTRDINLQNKAEYAGFRFVEPPEPHGSSPAS
jgi:predicted ribonuclease YlaK